jgi:hypothetical protein
MAKIIDNDDECKPRTRFEADSAWQNLEPDDFVESPKLEGRFACLPRSVLRYPPIKHRGDTAVGLATPFELRLVPALTCLARAQWVHERHKAAMAAGAEQMQQEQQWGDEYKIERDNVARQRKLAALRGEPPHTIPWPSRRHTFRRGSTVKPVKRRKAIRLAGEDGYNKVCRTSELDPPAQVVIETTAYDLLRLAGITPYGNYKKRVEAALERLHAPVGRHAVLLSSKEVGGRLRLTVSGHWVPVNDYAIVPMPMPSSPVVLALYLHIHCFDTREGAPGRKSQPFESLFKKLGIADMAPSHAKRVFDAALDEVNQHFLVGRYFVVEVTPTDDIHLAEVLEPYKPTQQAKPKAKPRPQSARPPSAQTPSPRKPMPRPRLTPAEVHGARRKITRPAPVAERMRATEHPDARKVLEPMQHQENDP